MDTFWYFIVDTNISYILVNTWISNPSDCFSKYKPKRYDMHKIQRKIEIHYLIGLYLCFVFIRFKRAFLAFDKTTYIDYEIVMNLNMSYRMPIETTAFVCHLKTVA